MKVLVLGCGLQGKAAIYDLCKSEHVQEIICADINTEILNNFMKFLDKDKIRFEKLDVENVPALLGLIRSADVVIDLLPSKFLDHVANIAVEAGTHVVNTMYGHQMSSSLNGRARAKGITILPEAGLDPGIDLILCGHGVRQFDEVHELHSWTGGIPDIDSIDNPLKYKISWTWYGVLLSYYRPARIMHDRKIIDIPPEDEFKEENVIKFDFPGVGRLEAFPNGDAITFCEHLGIVNTIRSTSRRAMRWEGHCSFWKSLVDLGFLSTEPVPGLKGVSPRQFMDKHLEPRLQYKDHEVDIVAMRTVLKGIKDGKKRTIVFDMVDKRDLATGLFAMNRTVGFTASAAAQMIVNGKINKRGLLTAVRDIPYTEMINELRNKGINIEEQLIE